MLSTLLPGFRQFRFPAKLFTFTTLGMAALAGLGWDAVAAGRGRRFLMLFLALLSISLIALAGVLYAQEPILSAFRNFDMGTTYRQL